MRWNDAASRLRSPRVCTPFIPFVTTGEDPRLHAAHGRERVLGGWVVLFFARKAAGGGAQTATMAPSIVTFMQSPGEVFFLKKREKHTQLCWTLVVAVLPLFPVPTQQHKSPSLPSPPPLQKMIKKIPTPPQKSCAVRTRFHFLRCHHQKHSSHVPAWRA